MGRSSSRRWWSYLTLCLQLCFLAVLPRVSLAKKEKPCSHNNDHSVANCSSSQLVEVPYRLHSELMILDLSHNKLSTIKVQSFSKYQNINELYLSNNSVHKISAMALQGLHNLKLLDLSNNHLQHIPTDSLATVALSLEKLVLNANRIEQIRKTDLEKLVKLQHFDISSNLLQHIDSNAFVNLNSLTVLKLSRNNLKTLPLKAFSSFPAGGVSAAGSGGVPEVWLSHNPWRCDCGLRWLWQWINETQANSTVQCDTPAMYNQKLLSQLNIDDLACQVQMKSSTFPISLSSGSNETLTCKYTSTPAAPARWQMVKKGAKPREVRQTSDGKFSIKYYTENGVMGDLVQISKLTIQDFQYVDIAKYSCMVENILGSASVDYQVTLYGVDPDSVTAEPPVGAAGEAGLDTRSIVIAVAVVSGVVLLVAIAVVITCGVNRMQRKKQIKQDAIVENVKQHFINNSEVVSMGDLDASKLSAKLNGKLPEDDQVDGRQSDDHGSDHTNDSNMTQLKRPLALEETEPLYVFEQPGSPLANGNTYVSFGSELADPAEESYTTLPLRGTQTLPHPGHASRHPSGRGYESSHAGSATPLLSDRYTPSVFDSDEPVEDYAQYPVYDSLTNSLQHPSHVSHNYTSGGESLHNSFHQPSHPREHTYSTSHPRGEHTYSTVDSTMSSGFYSLATHRASSPGKPRNDSLSSYSSGERADPGRHLSSFQYPPPSTPVMGGVYAPSPRTPSTARSTLTLAHPRYAPDVSYASDNPDMYGYHRPVHTDYRDYRDMRYPTATPQPIPPGGHMVPGKKSMSMSVGNLGYAPLVPASSPIPIGGGTLGPGPRKPPRAHQSREYMELTPQLDRTNTSNIGSHDSGGSSGGGTNGSYITSPEAQQYSQNYGITPGTPV